MANFFQPVLVITTVSTALMGGLFYSWSCGITQGLGKLPDLQYLSAMQSINREIQRPLFLLVFVGIVIILPFVTWQSYRAHQHSTLIYLAVASALYIFGVFAVTIAGNVPLNEMLDKVELSGSAAEVLKETRAAFEVKWNLLNRIRTICAVATLVCTVMGLQSSK